jgi:hypothetical protein
MRPLFAALSVALLAVLVVAAPVPKDKNAKEEPATDEQRKAVENNFKQLMIAVHSYHDAMGTWPADTKGGLSWRVQLLPYLEEDALYKQFDLNGAWDSDTNKKLIESMPKIYAPTRVMKAEKGETFYRGFGGTNQLTAGAFEPGKQLRLANFTDGLSNTIAVIDAGEPVVWTKPGTDLDPDAKEFPKLGKMIDGDYFFAAMCDGSVRQVKREFDEKEMRKFVGRNDGLVANDKLVFVK